MNTDGSLPGMKRDMDVIRALLLWAEKDMAEESQPELLKSVPLPVSLEHMALLIESGFVEGEVMWQHTGGRRTPVTVAFERLTWQGHEFISLLGRDEHWERVRSRLVETGVSWSLGALLDFLKTQAGRLWLGGP